MVYDRHFSPETIASTVVDFCDLASVNTVADFCSGRGALLDSVVSKYPSAEVYANDIDSDSTIFLSENRSNWVVENKDFLLDDFSPSGFSEFDLIVLNPPFSQKGAKRFSTSHKGNPLDGSKALISCVKSLNFLGAKGLLIAIVPEGALIAEKDQKIRDYLHRNFDFNVLARYPRGAFPDCSAKTAIISLKKNLFPQQPRINKRVITRSAPSSHFELYRGGAQMHNLKLSESDGAPLIHTTSIVQSEVDWSRTKTVDASVHKAISDPCVLIPRVGAISPAKVAVFSGSKKVVLSDCLFAVLHPNVSSARRMERMIKQNWESFSVLYGGTGAPYTTKQKLEIFLNRLEI